MGKPVNKPERLVLWPEQEAVAFAVEWANLPIYKDVDRVVDALNACDDSMDEIALIKPERKFAAGVKAETEKVRRWLADATGKRKGMSPAVVEEVNAELDKLKGLVVPSYQVTGFRKNLLSEKLVDFRPTPLAWAALGVALIADSRSEWRKRVGWCLYHTDRLVFNEPYEGKRGPLRKFYCPDSNSCKVMASRARAQLRK